MTRRIILVLSIALLVIFATAIAISFRGVTWYRSEDGFTCTASYWLSKGSMSWAYYEKRTMAIDVVSDLPSSSNWLVASRIWLGNQTIGHGPLVEVDGVVVWRAPLWPELVLFSLIPGYQLFFQYRERRRSSVGRCLSCGYNLTGNISGVCPECGGTIT